LIAKRKKLPEHTSIGEKIQTLLKEKLRHRTEKRFSPTYSSFYAESGSVDNLPVEYPENQITGAL